jgi:hypothetical protein
MKYLLLILLMLSACKKDDDGFTIYRVKAGNHKCMHWPERTLFQHSIAFEFKINDTWDMPYTGGWNKVAGIGLGNHHNNSCRLAYRCDDGKKVLGMYVYADGVRHEKRIGECPNGTYYCSISQSMGEWHLTIGGETHVLPAGAKKDAGMVLFPYIGGAETINHDWLVPIKFL